MADISLLFDVEGGGSISSGSGKLINDQLSSIVRQINSTPFEVTFKADEKSIAAIKSQLQDIFKTTGSVGNAPVAIPTLSLDTSNIKKELSEIKQEFDSLTRVTVGKTTTSKSSSKSVSAGGKTSSSTTDLAVDDKVLTRAANAIRTMETYRKSLIKSTDVDTSDLDRVISDVRELSSLYASGEVAVEDYTQAFDRLNREFAEFRLDSSANDALRDQISILSKVANLRSSMDKLRTSDVNASDADLRSVSMMTNRLGSLEDDYFSGGISLSEFSKEVSKVESNYRQLANARKEENALIEKKASLLNRVLQVQTSIAKAEQRTKGKIWDTEDADNTTLTKIKSESDRLRNSIAELDTGDVDVMAHALSRMEDELDSVVTGFREYSLATANVGRESIKATDGVKEYEAIMRKLHKTSVETHNALEKYSAAKYGKSGAEYKNLERLYSNISAAESNMGTRIDSGVSVGELAAEVDKYTSELVENTSAIKRNNEAHKSSFGHLGELASKFAQWFSLTQVMSTVFRWTRSMVDEVIAIDSAMTELKKVTDETDATYDNFLTNAAQRSRELGSSISDTVNATADFTRLGYSIEEAEAMADAAIVYKTVGDGIEDITEASESIIATMQAFGDETLSAMGIVDKFNNVGRNTCRPMQ